MFYHIMEMTKTTMKLIFRNKGFLFFGVALPILATLILNINNVGDVIVEKTDITELSGPDDQVAYLNDYTMFSVKVYDSSDSAIVASFLEHLANEGIFQIYRVDSSELTQNEIVDSAENTAIKDKIGAIIVIEKDFEKKIKEKKADGALTLYETSEDERYDLLVSTVQTILTQYSALGTEAADQDELEQQILEYENHRSQVETVQYDLEKGESDSLLEVDYERTDTLGYTMAILSLSFLFSGIMILSTIMTEKENLVFTRILLTKAGNGSYLLSKFLVIIATTIIQTGVTGIAFLFLVKSTLQISFGQFLFLVCLMGLIFNTLSVCIGICCESVLTAIYISFSVWVITALLGGLYFDISSGSEMMKRVAMLMPQRWMMRGAQMLMDGNSFAYPMILIVTAAYLIVILVVGMLGLNINRKE